MGKNFLPEEGLLQRTLDASARDERTTDETRESYTLLPYGSSFYDSVCNVDDRGSVTELFDSRWNWHAEPLVFSYMFTIRPGVVKGWGLHKLHEDRYMVLKGEMLLVMYDPRPDSPTLGMLSKVYLTGSRPRLINIPRFVWHADHNIGMEDVMVINFPTTPYDHKNPDKYRLPLDTDLIPYDFEGARGG